MTILFKCITSDPFSRCTAISVEKKRNSFSPLYLTEGLTVGIVYAVWAKNEYDGAPVGYKRYNQSFRHNISNAI